MLLQRLSEFKISLLHEQRLPILRLARLQQQADSSSKDFLLVRTRQTLKFFGTPPRVNSPVALTNKERELSLLRLRETLTKSQTQPPLKFGCKELLLLFLLLPQYRPMTLLLSDFLLYREVFYLTLQPQPFLEFLRLALPLPQAQTFLLVED